LFRKALAAAVMLAASLSAAHADGDAVAGKVVFKKCVACHEATGDKVKVGPPLEGVIGRAAGSHPGFQYSKNMVELGEAGLVWDEEHLEKYLRKPKDVVPKGTMAFAGLSKDDDIEDVIAYLEADPKP
jgi:cytochrome c